MNTRPDIEQLYKDNVLGNYGMPPVTLVRGCGARVWDDQGKEYLDFASGIAVNTLGHCHPRMIEAVQKQASELIHVSNLYRNRNHALLAAKLNEKAGGGGKVFFCNSGAEANEALLKLSRLYGQAKAGTEGACYKVVVAEKAFHGRTFGGMSATPQEKIQAGFRPLVPGFAVAKLNDLDSFANAIDDQTAAVFVETIQGESGINPANFAFLQGLRKLCDEKGVLLLIDEVQCGIGRTGTFFAFEHAGIRPDAIGMAKGLGGGLPIGAIWIDDKYAGLFKPGSHGSTFGGTPLVTAASLAVLETMDELKLMDNARALGDYAFERLRALQQEFPDYILGVRGRGFLIGIQIADTPAKLVAALRENGLIAPPAGTDVVRWLPPLIATRADIDEALAVFKTTVAQRVESLATAEA